MNEKTNKSQMKSFNDLPDELVRQIMTHLSSMGDKLRLGAVSRRLNRCANEHLRNSVWPLELHFAQPMFDSWRFFEVDVRAYITRMIITTARKTCFSHIILHVHNSKEIGSVQYACQTLTQHPECLSKTREFKIDCDRKSCCNHDNLPPLPAHTYEVLGGSPLLNVLHICGMSPDFPKLQTSLSGKELTEIVLEGIEVEYEALSNFFMSLKPNTLKNVSLTIKMERNNWTLAEFFQQMREGPWSALETLQYNFNVRLPAANFNVMGDLLNIFPNLVTCYPHCKFSFTPSVEDHIECINRFLKSAEDRSPSHHKRSVTFNGPGLGWQACNLVTLMERITDLYPERTCKLTYETIREGYLPIYKLTICSQDVTTFMITSLRIHSCGPFKFELMGPLLITDEHVVALNLPPGLFQGNMGAGSCAVCRRFYGTTIYQIRFMIMQQLEGHINHCFMNPCQDKQLRVDLRAMRPNDQVQVNRDPGTGRYAIHVAHLHMTVDSQACIVPGCNECLENLM